MSHRVRTPGIIERDLDGASPRDASKSTVTATWNIVTEQTLDGLGPADYLIIESPAKAANFTGEMAQELPTLVDNGTIRGFDLIILAKNDDGTVDAMELEDIEDLGELRTLEGELAELLAEEDVVKLAAAMDPGNTAASSSTKTYGRRRSCQPHGMSAVN
jgi:hypothetical protein